MSQDIDYTLLLRRATSGDAAAASQFFNAAYAELKRMAARALRDEPSAQLLQPTALVHEAFLRVWRDGARWDNRRHFFGAAARSMRQVLVDEARRRGAEKRGAGVAAMSLSAAEAEPMVGGGVDLLRLDTLMHELEMLNPRYARMVELRHFAGFGIEETADLLDVSPATVKRDWAFVRAWLLDRLQA